MANQLLLMNPPHNADAPTLWSLEERLFGRFHLSLLGKLVWHRGNKYTYLVRTATETNVRDQDDILALLEDRRAILVSDDGCSWPGHLLPIFSCDQEEAFGPILATFGQPLPVYAELKSKRRLAGPWLVMLPNCHTIEMTSTVFMRLCASGAIRRV